MRDEEKRTISRGQLTALRDQIENGGMGASHDLDVELFKLFNDLPVHLIDDDDQVRSPLGKRWVHDVPTSIVFAEDGTHRNVFEDVGSPTDDGWVWASPQRSIPAYLRDGEHAFAWKHSISGQSRLLNIAELEDDLITKWRATIIVDESTVASGESYDMGTAIVLAVLNDLIANERACWWVRVTD